MASAQLVIPSSRCADSHCSRFALRFVSAEPWTHHRTCSNHLVCRRDGSHCRVCEGWSEATWDGLERLMARLAARQEKRRKAGWLSDTGSTSEDSLLPEGRLIIDEMPAKEVEVETSLPGKSPRASPEARGRASGSERSSSGDRSGPARPSPARGFGKKKGSKSSSSSSRRAESGREGGTKHSSSASSSHKKKKSSSSSSGEAKKRARERSPHRSAAPSLPGTPRSSRVEGLRAFSFSAPGCQNSGSIDSGGNGYYPG